MTLQVSNIAGDGETWRRHVTPKTHRGVCPAWPAKGNKAWEGLHPGMRTRTGVRHNADARAGRRSRREEDGGGGRRRNFLTDAEPSRVLWALCGSEVKSAAMSATVNQLMT